MTGLHSLRQPHAKVLKSAAAAAGKPAGQQQQQHSPDQVAAGAGEDKGSNLVQVG